MSRLLKDEPSFEPNYMQPAVAGRAADAKRETWLSPFYDAWCERYGGKPAVGPLAKALKTLVDEFGPDAVLGHWSAYLQSTDARFANPARFAQTYGSWSGQSRRSTPNDNYLTPAQLRGIAHATE
jgi:hypothetical protein